jgi:hypothetical protein
MACFDFTGIITTFLTYEICKWISPAISLLAGKAGRTQLRAIHVHLLKADNTKYFYI